MAAIRLASMRVRGIATRVETSETGNPETIRPIGVSVVLLGNLIMRSGLTWLDGRAITAEESLDFAAKLMSKLAWVAKVSFELTRLVDDPIAVTRYRSSAHTRAYYKVEGNDTLFGSLTDALIAAGFNLKAYQQMD